MNKEDKIKKIEEANDIINGFSLRDLRGDSGVEALTKLRITINDFFRIIKLKKKEE